jgi:ribonuclease-3
VQANETSGADGLRDLEARLGHTFGDGSLLETALQHASFANESADRESNERLEFLGDGVIGLAVGHLLFETFPEWREGELTRAQSKLVDRSGLASLARRLDLGPCICLGRTEQQSQGSEKGSILADTMEAIFGAMFLDAGMQPVVDLARRMFADDLKADAAPVDRDPKTRFQEVLMAEYGVFPSYQLVADSGIEGDDARFTIEAGLEDVVTTIGIARTKRGAEQAAAEAALAILDAGEAQGTLEPKR